MCDQIRQNRFSEPNFLQSQPPENKIPIEGRRNVLVCAALPYVNNVPHLGNIIGAVLSADVFARYCNMREYQCLYICGTDEYGTATEIRALTEGVSPKEICDKFHKLHKEAYHWFGIDFDCFGRTSSEHQTEIVQDIFLKIHNNGFTSVGIQKQLHCSNCQKFLADRFVRGICPHCKFPDARGDQCDKCGHLLDGVELIEPKCLICGCEPRVEESEHIFLNLDQLSPKVQTYLDSVVDSPSSHWSSNAISITRSWMKTGLERRCITRDLKWGIPVPLSQFSSKVFYVWFDATIGYLSITKSLLGSKWINWWKNPEQVELYHFLGKDNVSFHTIIFPASLLATGEKYTHPRHMCATEYLNYEDQKFSKSRGVGVFGDTVAQIGIPADVLRFYLIYMRPEGQDTSFCWDDLVLKVNSELLANLGNFVHRALSFLSSFFSGVQPKIELGPVEDELFVRIDEDLKEFISAMEDVRMRDALHWILSISRRGNQYMQAGQPWVLVKSDKGEDKQRAQTIIGVSANLSLFLSIMLQPFMPKTSAQIREQCNIPSPMALPEQFTLLLKKGHQHNKPSPLFTKIEPNKVAEWKALFGGDQNSTAVAINGTLNNKSSPKKSKQQNQQKKSKMASSDAVDLSSIDINKLYSEVLAKFQKAKEIFVAKEMTRLDVENKALREQIEEFKIKLGYVGPLFSPPITSDIPTKTPTKTDSKSDVLKQPFQNIIPTAEKGENMVQKPKQSKKSENKKTAAPSGGDVGGGEIDVGRLDLRVGRIIQAKKHPDADALYVEEIDLGEEKPRTVVSGLVRFVPLEEMQNRLVVCLCNLKPAKMRGVESQAMVMCASTPEKVEILEIDPSCEPGDVVICESFAHRPDLPFMNPKKKIWEGVAPELSVSETGECIYKGHQLRVSRNGSALKARTLCNVPVK